MLLEKNSIVLGTFVKYNGDICSEMVWLFNIDYQPLWRFVHNSLAHSSFEFFLSLEKHNLHSGGSFTVEFYLVWWPLTRFGQVLT